MKNRIILILIIYSCTITLQLQAQSEAKKTQIYFYGGMSSYKMSALKNFNSQTVSHLPFDVNIVNNFPTRPYLGASITQELTKAFSLGLNYQFHSTGSRLGMKDYSGYYQIDNIYSAHSVGLELQLLFTSSPRFNLFGNITSGVYFGNLSISDEIKILEQPKVESNEKLVSLSPFILPSLKFKFRLSSKISWVTIIGGLIDIGGKIQLKGNNDIVLQNNNEEVKSGWSGFRAHTGLELEF